MSKKHACTEDKLLVKGKECPINPSHKMTDNWKGRMAFLDTEKSDIAKRIGVTKEGEYAIKVR